MSIIVSNRTEKIISDFIGKKINSPEQRLIQGATALAIQPYIDFNNKNADDQTRAVSVARTVGKIVAGTLVGVSVRYGCIALAKRFSRFTIEESNNFIKSIKRKTKKDILLPEFNPEFFKEMTKKDFLERYDKAIKTTGTIFATFAMVFTNFLIDAPLTKYITKKLTPYVKKRIEKTKRREVTDENI